jgi:O-antigen/teichoic acid export membrane protein
MNIARSSLRIFLANLLSTLVVFGGLTYFARELGSGQMGSFFLFQAILSIITIVADFGVGKSINKRISEGSPVKKIYSTSLLMKLSLLLPFIFSIFYFDDIINSYIGEGLAIYLILVLILQELARSLMEGLKGELRVGEIAGPVLARRVVYIGIGMLLVAFNYNVTGVVYGLIAGLIVMIIWGITKVSDVIARPSLEQARSLVNYSKYAFILSVEGTVYNWIDIAIIGFLLAQSDVGVYEMAWRVTAITMLFSRSVATSIFPQVSKWSVRDSYDHIEELLSKVITPILFISIPAFFGILVLSQEILGILFGEEYASGWIVLIILMFEKLIRSIYIILSQSLQGIDRPDLAAKASGFSILLNIVLNSVLILYIGIVGAAIATAISLTVNTFIHATYLSKFININIRYGQVGWIIFSSVTMAVIVSLIEFFIRIDTLVKLFTIIVLGAALYFLISVMNKGVRETLTNSVEKLI